MLYTDAFDHVFLPSQAPRSALARKLVVVLHGRGDSLEPFLEFNRELGLSEMNFLLLNAPRRYLDGYTWYAFPPHQANGVLKARARLNNLFEDLEEQGWSSCDVFLFGFSQGALIAGDYLLHGNYSLAGVVGVAGYIYFFENWQRQISPHAYQTPWLMTHGWHDDALDIEVTRAHIRRLQAIGLPVEWQEFAKGHEIEATKEIPFLRRWIKSKAVGRAASLPARGSPAQPTRQRFWRPY